MNSLKVKIVFLACSLLPTLVHAGGVDNMPSRVSTQPPSSDVLAQGVGGQLTQDGVDAYIEALQFCLGQLGSPKTMSPAERTQISQVLTQGFASLPVGVQQTLANARQTWNLYQSSWNNLSRDQQTAFAYDVLAFAFGEQAAAQALGLNNGNVSTASDSSSSSSSSSSSTGSTGFSEPCYMCTEEGSISYGGGIDMGGGEFSY